MIWFLLAPTYLASFALFVSAVLRYCRDHEVSTGRIALWSLGGLFFVIVGVLVIVPTTVGYILDAMYT